MSLALTYRWSEHYAFSEADHPRDDQGQWSSGGETKSHFGLTDRDKIKDRWKRYLAAQKQKQSEREENAHSKVKTTAAEVESAKNYLESKIAESPPSSPKVKS